MGIDTLHIVAIVPPQPILSTLMMVADRLQKVSPSSRRTLLPHLCLTAVYDHVEGIDAWKSELRNLLSVFRPFTIEASKPVRMSHGLLPDNFSLPVPTTTELEAISRAAVTVTRRHFPDLEESGLRSLVDHIYLVENIPEYSRHFVVREAMKVWSPQSFAVDRIQILDVDGPLYESETILLNGVPRDVGIRSIRLNENERWIMAMLHALGRFVESKLKYQKMLFFVDYEELNQRNRFEYSSFEHGPWSGLLEANTRDLENLGLLEYRGYTVSLTNLGNTLGAKAYSELSRVERDAIMRCVMKHGSKSTREIQTYVHYTYPDLHVLGRAYPDD
ncbi:MAG: hypothetical protein ACREBU_15600 [Nitrososphaera sp.]